MIVSFWHTVRDSLVNERASLVLLFNVGGFLPPAGRVFFWHMVRDSLMNEIDLLFNLCLPMYLYTTRNRAILNIGGNMR